MVRAKEGAVRQWSTVPFHCLGTHAAPTTIRNRRRRIRNQQDDRCQKQSMQMTKRIRDKNEILRAAVWLSVWMIKSGEGQTTTTR